jgi:hypothetical protein
MDIAGQQLTPGARTLDAGGDNLHRNVLCRGEPAKRRKTKDKWCPEFCSLQGDRREAYTISRMLLTNGKKVVSEDSLQLTLVIAEGSIFKQQS